VRVHGGVMFERFTDRARRAVVSAQEEARRLQHNYIGTEHILLGLLAVRGGVAYKVLDQFGMSQEGVREEVVGLIGIGSTPMSGHIPFTPRAKKTLELSLREALQLNHNYIGTEHVLLGLVREGEGVAAQIITGHGADLDSVRQAVIELLRTYSGQRSGQRWLRGLSGAAEAEGTDLPATPAAEASVTAAIQLAGSEPIGSHHLLLAALEDPASAAARTLAGLGVDLDQAREALRTVDVTGTSDEQPEERGRRHMVLRVTDTSLIIEATDPDIVKAAQAAAEALGGQADPPGTIRGDLPESVSLGGVWLALNASLQNIRTRATAAQAKAGEAQPGPENARLQAEPEDPPGAAGATGTG
jgi:ATP-dependent Clp protease ATP-binding subunit ClpA